MWYGMVWYLFTVGMVRVCVFVSCVWEGRIGCGATVQVLIMVAVAVAVVLVMV